MLFIILSFALPLIGPIGLSGGILIAFIFCFAAVLAFEFVNGFHDTANAVATVIYTKTLKPYPAIIWSAFWNFLGVFIIGTAVAMSLLKLVPLDKLITLPLPVGACLIIAILLASIIWNLGTWYFGLPLSSSHTLIGAMIGASLSFSYYYGGKVNWSQAGEIGLSLLTSPIIGFVVAALLMYTLKHIIKTDKLFHAPENENDKPPMPIRILLVTTCTLVSFFHGSNDGQKGVGLLMLVLIAFLPATFAFNPKIDNSQTSAIVNRTQQALRQVPLQGGQQKEIARLQTQLNQFSGQIDHKNQGNVKQKFALRSEVQQLAAGVKQFAENNHKQLPKNTLEALSANAKKLQSITDYAPTWVLLCISGALGLGTTIGWKRIVVTIGERIGNEHLNYAEGASAELVAAATIGISTSLGLPVSTTHVLSSGVAGAMAASNGAKNINYGTIKHIITAWLLTLPAAIVLSGGLFALFRLFI